MDGTRAQEIDLAKAIMILPSCLPASETFKSDTVGEEKVCILCNMAVALELIIIFTTDSSFN